MVNELTKQVRNKTKHPAAQALHGWKSRKQPICQEWLNDHNAFFKWVDTRKIPFIKGLSRFSRKDKTKEWSPENARFYTNYG